MKAPIAVMLIAAALPLSACGEGGQEPPPGASDTSFEAAAPNPVPDGDTGPAPVPDNTSVVGGPDEEADAILDYDAEAPPQPAATPAD